jgi:prepilin-type N-terminal cleavage/methylation domain-containing protein
MKTDKKGFSLVEVMIVVAILSLIAVIGIPQYSKFKQKSRETEAKVALSSLFAAEKSFHGEYGFFHTTLAAIGFGVEGRIYFNVGFGTPTVASPSAFGFDAPLDDSIVSTRQQCTGSNGTGTDTRCTFLVDVPDLPIEATSSGDAFLGAAISWPDLYARQPGSTQNSIWSMIAENLFLSKRTAAAGPITPLPPDYVNECMNAMDIESCSDPRTFSPIVGVVKIWTVNSFKTFRTN